MVYQYPIFYSVQRPFGDRQSGLLNPGHSSLLDHRNPALLVNVLANARQRDKTDKSIFSNKNGTGWKILAAAEVGLALLGAICYQQGWWPFLDKAGETKVDKSEADDAQTVPVTLTRCENYSPEPQPKSVEPLVEPKLQTVIVEPQPVDKIQEIGQDIREAAISLMQRHKSLNASLQCICWEDIFRNLNAMLSQAQYTCSGGMWYGPTRTGIHNLVLNPIQRQVVPTIGNSELKIITDKLFTYLKTQPTKPNPAIQIQKTVGRSGDSIETTASRIEQAVIDYLARNPDAMEQFKDCNWNAMIMSAADIIEQQRHGKLATLYNSVPAWIKPYLVGDPTLRNMADRLFTPSKSSVTL